MQFKEKYGAWAIIAGSAEGLGEAWSETLAKRGLNLVMIDIEEDKMKALSKRLKEKYSIETREFQIDLVQEKASAEIMTAVKEMDCRLLIYNAAYSRVKPFLENTDEDIRNYTGINIYTKLQLVHAFTKFLIDHKKKGGVILMSSLAGLIGMQLVATYAATKAFAWNLAEALHHEMKPHGIDVMACIAGATSTSAYLDTDPKYGKIKPLVMAPEDVSEEAVKKLGKKARHITGFSNRMNYFILTRLLPRRMAARMANRVMKKMYAHE